MSLDVLTEAVYSQVCALSLITGVYRLDKQITLQIKDNSDVTVVNVPSSVVVSELTLTQVLITLTMTLLCSGGH